MTGQQPGPRIVPPEEARIKAGWRRQAPWIIDLAHTAAVLGEENASLKEQLAKALALHPRYWIIRGDLAWCPTCKGQPGSYPCPTARALGVSE